MTSSVNFGASIKSISAIYGIAVANSMPSQSRNECILINESICERRGPNKAVQIDNLQAVRFAVSLSLNFTAKQTAYKLRLTAALDQNRTVETSMETNTQSDYRLRKLMPFIIAVLDGSNAREIEFEGSAFVLHYKNKIFVVSAAHALEKFSNQYQPKLGFHDRVCTLSIDKIIKTDSQNNDIGNLDLGALLVKDSCEHYEALRKISLSPEQLNFDNSELDYKTLAIVGYPVKSNSRVKYRNCAEVTGNVVGHFYEHDPEFDLTKVECSPARHMAISWPQKDEKGNKTQIPLGISGAPVWAIVGDENTEHAVVVGVFISHHTRYKVGVYTDIKLLIQLLDSHIARSSSDSDNDK